MPDDSNGIYSVPDGTIVTTGDTILPSQHNPWANDSASAISNRFSKDGRAPATGNWNINNFRLTNVGAPVAGGDAVNKTYADGLNSLFSSKGHIFGLTLSNNGTDATNDIDVATGEAASDGTIPYLMVLGSALTKRLDAAWAVGSGNGGLDTGSIANGTYHVWLIQRSDTGVVDALFSASASSPTMPTNYDRKRRIGSFIRESGVIFPFTQNGDEFLLKTAILSVSANNAGESAVTRTLNVPTGIVVYAKFNGVIRNLGSAVAASVVFTSLDVNDQAPAFNPPSGITYSLGPATTGGSSAFAGEFAIRTNTSAQIRSRQIGSDANVTLYMSTLGWIDSRGKN